MINKETAEFETGSPEDTRLLGMRIGGLVVAGDVILLDGTLGAGKTHLTQGIARALGIKGAVRSPTFTFVHEYPEGRIPLYHIDLYRTEGSSDLATIGLESYFDQEGVVVVEWSAKGAAWLPVDALHVSISRVGESRRSFRFGAAGDRALNLLNALRKAGW
jgi:tRNA threonylcarbamoyladenosine biosynthesis protein TsaE